MGISLNGLTPAGTYPGLIKTGDNTAIDGTLKGLSDGNGNNLPMEVSTTGVNLTGSPTVNSVAIANTTQVAAKQDTLVSGTNIKTINGTTILGSGNIVTPSTNPSGVSGAIQFSNGSAFASDAANLFWDDTNKRLGIGTNTPNTRLHILSANDPIGGNFTTRGNLFIATPESASINVGGTLALGGYFAGTTSVATFGKVNGKKESSSSGATDGYLSFETLQNVGNNLIERMRITSIGNIGIGETAPTSRLQIKGSGSTSATTSLLVQNSAGTQIAEFRDDLQVSVRSTFRVLDTAGNNAMIMYGEGISGTKTLWVNGSVGIGVLGNNASARLQVDSTTQGFLPPRMTTTQKNAIASPTAGLVVYDSTTNKLQCYNGSTWNDLF